MAFCMNPRRSPERRGDISGASANVSPLTRSVWFLCLVRVFAVALLDSIPLILYCSGYFTQLVRTGGTGHREDRTLYTRLLLAWWIAPYTVFFNFAARRFRMRKVRLLNALWVQMLGSDHLWVIKDLFNAKESMFCGCPSGSSSLPVPSYNGTGAPLH